MKDFRFDKTLGDEERAMLVKEEGEQAMKNHAILIANFYRIWSLFPLQWDDPAALDHWSHRNTH